MVEALLYASSLADRNEFANAPYVAALLPDFIAVTHQWARTAQLRAFCISQVSRSSDFIATHETALWIHTGLATLALERSLSFAQPSGSQRAGARRTYVQQDHVVTIAGMHLTTPERTAVDLLLANLETGISYLRVLVRTCPSMSVDSVRECAWQMGSQRGIRRVRSVLDELVLSPPNHA